MKTFIAVDIETTGLNPQSDCILEIGGVKVVEGEIKETFSKLINPQIQIPRRITEITGIDDAMVKGAETVETVMEQFLEFAGEGILLGHNVKFDYSFLKVNADKMGHSFARNGIDTLYIARTLLPELESKSLASLCVHYGIENPCAHRAFEDAQTAAKLYFKLQEEFLEKNQAAFLPRELYYKIKKEEPITKKQKNYLLDLLKYHKIQGEAIWNTVDFQIDSLSKREASKKIDEIILHYGRIY